MIIKKNEPLQVLKNCVELKNEVGTAMLKVNKQE